MWRSFAEGTDFQMEVRVTGGDDRLWPGLAEELADLNVDVIVATTTWSGLAAKDQTSTIPIVVALSGDPVGTGLIPDPAAPSENVTGVTDHNPAQASEQVSRIQEFLEHNGKGPLATLGVLYNGGNQGTRPDLEDVQDAANAASVALVSLDVRTDADFERALNRAVDKGVQAVIVLGDPLIVHNRDAIITLLEDSTRQLPAIWGVPELAEEGGLMAYGPRHFQMFRDAADLAVSILQQQPGQRLTFVRGTQVGSPPPPELVLNTQAATNIGCAFPSGW
jgi:putative tryptophan/tyrosine transport system substrate-binding protein